MNIALPTDVPETLRYALEENEFIFSGFKTFHQMREIGISMLDDNGNIKPFNTFKEEALKINSKYNVNYLYAEHKLAVASSQMAAKWEEMKQNEDRYLLQYRTANDEKVRETHAALHNITLPMSDPFWNDYYPPNGWGCRCNVVQVRKGKYEESDPKQAKELGDECTSTPKQRIFRFNPGKTMQLFPPKHPYYKVPDAAKVKHASEGYIPTKFNPGDLIEAEKFFTDKLGVKCALDGFKKEDMPQIEEIFRCTERHFEVFPELKKETLFVGTLAGRIRLLADEFLKKWLQDPIVAKDIGLAQSSALKRSIRENHVEDDTTAFSIPFRREYGLCGVVFNEDYRGERIIKANKKSVETKFRVQGAESLKATIDHEFGHQIDNILGISEDKDFLKIYIQETNKGKQYIIDSLSEYATQDKGEFVAEAWAEYLNNKEPRPIAVAVGRLIKKKYSEKYN